MEKKFYAAIEDTFEFRTKPGMSWTADDIWDEYTSGRHATGGSTKMFDTREEAAASLGGYCRTREERGQIGMLLTGTLTYVEEQIWDVDDDGELNDLLQGGDIPVLNIEPFKGDDADD